ncbi:MAG: carbohydrate porin, partial [Succinivibrio sp.]|nr:carbohydrate porin [Succinivibrio sp.]
PDAGNWKSRPELRFYVTYLHGNHNEALRNSPTQDKAMTIHYKNGVVEKYDHPRDNQVIFGAQLEAWW